MASDAESEYGYDLSLEDETLLASLADAVQPANNNGSDSATQLAGTSQKRPYISSVGPRLSHQHAPDIMRGSPQGKMSLVGIGRTDSVDAFVQNTQPQPVTYPDCR